eukprot:PhF_6_TR16956/c0_g1_i1/m.25575
MGTCGSKDKPKESSNPKSAPPAAKRPSIEPNRGGGGTNTRDPANSGPDTPEPNPPLKPAETWKVATFNLWNRAEIDSNLASLANVAPFLKIRRIQNRMHTDVFIPQHSPVDDVCQSLRVLCEVTECNEALKIAEEHLNDLPHSTTQEDMPGYLNEMFNEMFERLTSSSVGTLSTLGAILRSLQAGMSAPAEYFLQNKIRQLSPDLNAASLEEGEEIPHFLVTVNKATSKITTEHTKSIRVKFVNEKPEEKLSFSWSIAMEMPSFPINGCRKYTMMPDTIQLQIVDVCCSPYATPRTLSAAAAITELGRNDRSARKAPS